MLGIIGVFSFLFFGNLELLRQEFTINTVIATLGNPVLIVFLLIFGLLSFGLANIENKNEEQRNLTRPKIHSHGH
jgi:hypothetical protein